MAMSETNSEPEHSNAEPLPEGTVPLRRRRNEAVAVERRRSTGGFDIAAALELYLDHCKTRRAMLELLEQWLAEGRQREQDDENLQYIAAVERAIETMKRAPDVPTAIVMLQRR
jgi:hypothetical protein